MSREKLFAVTERNSNIIHAIIKESFKEFFNKNMPLFDIIEINPSVGITSITITDNNENYYLNVHEYEPIERLESPLYPNLYFIHNSYHTDDMNKINKLVQEATNIIKDLPSSLHIATYMSILPGMFIECWNGTKGYVIENNGDSLIIDDELCPEVKMVDIRNIHRTPKKKQIEPIINYTGSISSNIVLEESIIIPFEELNKDSILINYHGEQAKFIDKAIGIEEFKNIKKYDESGSMYELLHKPESFGYKYEDLENLQMVAVKHDDGEYCVYTYDDGGVQAYKNNDAFTKC